MREWWGVWFNKYASLAILSAASVAGYNGICWQCLTASDWGTWIGALGTVGALIGAIVIASKQSMELAREKRIRARIYAPGLLMRLTNVEAVIERVILDLSQPPGPMEEVMQCWYNELTALDVWSLEEMEAVACLPNECAVNLALVKEAITHTVGGLRYQGKYTTVKELLEVLTSIIPHGVAASEELQHAMDERP